MKTRELMEERSDSLWAVATRRVSEFHVERHLFFCHLVQTRPPSPDTAYAHHATAQFISFKFD